MYQRTGIRSNIQSPEGLNTLYIRYQGQGDTLYREVGYEVQEEY